MIGEVGIINCSTYQLLADVMSGNASVTLMC